MAVVMVSMIKDAFEDYKRHRSDSKENQQLTIKYTKSSKDFWQCPWDQVKVGDIVKVEQDKYIPADMVILQSSDPKGVCYVETKNLDGETNMKMKTCHKDL